MLLLKGDFSEKSDVRSAGNLVADGHILAVDNDWVHAIWLDSLNQDSKLRVSVVKGSVANKPFGLTIPNERFLEYVDMDRLNRSTWALFEGNELTQRTGALVFWRLPGKKEVENDLPSAVWSRDSDGLPVIQNWSPEGKPNVASLLHYAATLGVKLPACTSLNTTKEPEITAADEAERFAATHRLSLLTDKNAARLIAGSFPIMSGDKAGLHVSRGRPDAIGYVVLSRLMDAYAIEWSDPRNVHPGWDDPELQKLQGPELRLGILALAGWAS